MKEDSRNNLWNETRDIAYPQEGAKREMSNKELAERLRSILG